MGSTMSELNGFETTSCQDKSKNQGANLNNVILQTAFAHVWFLHQYTPPFSKYKILVANHIGVSLIESCIPSHLVSKTR